MLNISELYLFMPAWCLQTPSLILLNISHKNMLFKFISMYEVVVFNLNQQEVYFQLFSTVVNYVQKMELVKTICLQVKLRVKRNKLDAQFSHQLSATEHQTMTTIQVLVASTPIAQPLSHSPQPLFIAHSYRLDIITFCAQYRHTYNLKVHLTSHISFRL